MSDSHSYIVKIVAGEHAGEFHHFDRLDDAYSFSISCGYACAIFSPLSEPTLPLACSQCDRDAEFYMESYEEHLALCPLCAFGFAFRVFTEDFRNDYVDTDNYAFRIVTRATVEQTHAQFVEGDIASFDRIHAHLAPDNILRCYSALDVAEAFHRMAFCEDDFLLVIYAGPNARVEWMYEEAGN